MVSVHTTYPSSAKCISHGGC